MNRSATAVAALVALFGCKHYAAVHPYEVEAPASQAPADPASTYNVLRDLLVEAKYQVLGEDTAARTVRVRAQVSEGDSDKASFIDAEVEPDGNVLFRPSGFLVKQDGSVQSRLDGELTRLERKLKDRLLRHASSRVSTAEATPPGAESTSADEPDHLPRAWSEAAYDPKTWGDGKFTCVPVKLPSDTRQMKLRLSNGEDADVSISVAYSAGLCRSASECHLPEGCPALGLGDSQKVSRLAEAIAGGQIGHRATVMLEGRPVATIDLAAHGSVSQALKQH